MGGLAVDADHIYWTSSTDFSDGDGAVWAAGLDGSNPHIIVPGQNDPHGVAADASHLYWADLSTINEAGLDGTSPQAIVQNQPAPAGVAVSPP
jgi:hypothetical protein